MSEPIKKSVIMIPEEVRSFKDVYGNMHENQQDALAKNKEYALTYYLCEGLALHGLTHEELATFLIDNAKWIKEYLP